MEREQRSQTDVTINNIMILAHDKNDARSSETATTSLTCDSSNTADIASNKNDIIRIEINKEMDKLFGPALERARSGSDIEVAAPLMQKRRQCRSQEVLTSERPLTENQISGSSDAGLNVYQFQDSRNANESNVPPVSILYDNQRAEIIASVTERLYNKLKRNERSVSKMESIVDKKIMQPLNELKICSNARQRLVELSQKAMRNKRKISIPAATQTKKHAIRVKHQEIDIQTDLQPYTNYRNRSCIFQKDISTETVPLTPRYRERAVGSKFGTLNGSDRSTETEHIIKTYKEAYTMTDTIRKLDSSTQTYVLPPPRRKRRMSTLSKYLKKSESFRSTLYDKSVSPIININISPVCSVESHSSDEQSSASVTPEIKSRLMIPDLCQNHNSLNVINSEHKDIRNKKINAKTDVLETAIKTIPSCDELEKKNDFSDEDEVSILPRVTVEPTRKVSCQDYEDLVLGRNAYPYSIELSPCKEINEEKKVITFKDIDITPAECCSTEWLEKLNDTSSLSKTVPKQTSLIDNFNNSDDKCYKEKSQNICNLQNNLQIANSKSYLITETKNCDEKKGNIPKNSESCVANSLCKHELRAKQRIDCSSSDHLYDKLKSFERKTENNSGSLDFAVDRNKLVHNVCNINQYSNSGVKLTPTEYLKQLIQIRREAVADSNKKVDEY